MDRRIRRGDLPALRECLALLGRNNALAHHDIARLCAGDTRRQRRITDALTLHGCISVPKYGAECHFVKGANTDYARVYEMLEKEAKGAWKRHIKWLWGIIVPLSVAAGFVADWLDLFDNIRGLFL